MSSEETHVYIKCVHSQLAKLSRAQEPEASEALIQDRGTRGCRDYSRRVRLARVYVLMGVVCVFILLYFTILYPEYCMCWVIIKNSFILLLPKR